MGGVFLCLIDFIKPIEARNNENDAQGIEYSLITTTVSNACAVNFPDDMVAVFVPNETITVNFKDRDTTETVTCTYDTEFTLPDPPTRIGYVFTGWKVKK